MFCNIQCNITWHAVSKTKIWIVFTACGENKKIFNSENDREQTESTDAGEFGLCSYTVVSDRYAITAEHCILAFSGYCWLILRLT